MLSRTKMLRGIVRPCQRYLSAQDIYQEDTRQFIDMLKNSKEADIFKGCNVSGRVLGVNYFTIFLSFLSFDYEIILFQIVELEN